MYFSESNGSVRNEGSASGDQSSCQRLNQLICGWLRGVAEGDGEGAGDAGGDAGSTLFAAAIATFAAKSKAAIATVLKVLRIPATSPTPHQSLLSVKRLRAGVGPAPP